MSFKLWKVPFVAIVIILTIGFVAKLAIAEDKEEKLYILVGKITQAEAMFNTSLLDKDHGTVFIVKLATMTQDPVSPLSLGPSSVSYSAAPVSYDFISINAALGWDGPFIFEKTNRESGRETPVTGGDIKAFALSKCHPQCTSGIPASEVTKWAPLFYSGPIQNCHGGSSVVGGEYGYGKNVLCLGSCADSWSSSLTCIKLTTDEVVKLFKEVIPAIEEQNMWMMTYGKTGTDKRRIYLSRIDRRILRAEYASRYACCGSCNAGSRYEDAFVNIADFWQCYGGTSASRDDVFQCLKPPTSPTLPDKCSYWYAEKGAAKPFRKLFVRVPVEHGSVYVSFFPSYSWGSNNYPSSFVVKAKVLKVNLDVNCYKLNSSARSATKDTDISDKVKGIKLKNGYDCVTDCDACNNDSAVAMDAGAIGTQVALTADTNKNVYFIGLNGSRQALFKYDYASGRTTPISRTVKVVNSSLSVSPKSGAEAAKSGINRLFAAYNSSGDDWLWGSISPVAVGSTFAGKGAWVFALDKSTNTVRGGYYDESARRFDPLRSRTSGVQIVGNPEGTGIEVIDVATDGRGNLYAILLKYEAIDGSGNQKVHLQVWKYKNDEFLKASGTLGIPTDPRNVVDFGVIKVNTYDPRAASSVNIAAAGTSKPPAYISPSLHVDFDANTYMPPITVTTVVPPMFPDESPGHLETSVLTNSTSFTKVGSDWVASAFPVGNDLEVGMEAPPVFDPQNMGLNKNYPAVLESDLGTWDKNGDGRISALPNSAIVKKVDLNSDGKPELWTVAFRYVVSYMENDKTIKLVEVYGSPALGRDRANYFMQWVADFYDPVDGRYIGSENLGNTKFLADSADPASDIENTAWKSKAANPVSVKISDALASKLAVKFLKAGKYKIESWVEYLKLDLAQANRDAPGNLSSVMSSIDSELVSAVRPSGSLKIDGKDAPGERSRSGRYVKREYVPLRSAVIVNVKYDVKSPPTYIDNMEITFNGAHTATIKEDENVASYIQIKFRMQFVRAHYIASDTASGLTEVYPGIGCWAYKDFIDGKGNPLGVSATPNNRASSAWTVDTTKRHDGTNGRYGANNGGTYAYTDPSEGIRTFDRKIVHWYLVIKPKFEGMDRDLRFDWYRASREIAANPGVTVMYGDLTRATVTPTGRKPGEFDVVINLSGELRFLVPGTYEMKFGLEYPTVKWTAVTSSNPFSDLVPDLVKTSLFDGTPPGSYLAKLSGIDSTKVDTNVSFSDINDTNPNGVVKIYVKDKTPPEIVRFDINGTFTTGDPFVGRIGITVRENAPTYRPADDYIPVITASAQSTANYATVCDRAKITSNRFFVKQTPATYWSVTRMPAALGDLYSQIRKALWDGTASKPNPYKHYIYKEYSWEYLVTDYSYDSSEVIVAGRKDKEMYVAVHVSMNGFDSGYVRGSLTSNFDIDSSGVSGTPVLYDSRWVDWSSTPSATINAYPANVRVSSLGWAPLVRKFSVADNDAPDFKFEIFNYYSLKKTTVSLEGAPLNATKDEFALDSATLTVKKNWSKVGKFRLTLDGEIGANWQQATKTKDIDFDDNTNPTTPSDKLFVGSGWTTYPAGPVVEGVSLMDDGRSGVVFPAKRLLFIRGAKATIKILASDLKDNITDYGNRSKIDNLVKLKYEPANVFITYSWATTDNGLSVTLLPTATCEVGTLEVKVKDDAGNVRAIWIPFKVVPALQQNTIYNIQGGKRIR